MISTSCQRYNGGNCCSQFWLNFEITSKFVIFFCKIDIEKIGFWRFYRSTTKNWRQIWIWFDSNFKGFRVQTEIFAVVSDWISKQQLNLLFFLPNWRIYWATRRNENQIWLWFIKRFWVQLKIYADTPDWISKQKLSFSLLLLDWYCRS